MKSEIKIRKLLNKISNWIKEQQEDELNKHESVTNSSYAFGLIEVAGRMAEITVSLEFDEDEWDEDIKDRG